MSAAAGMREVASRASTVSGDFAASAEKVKVVVPELASGLSKAVTMAEGNQGGLDLLLPLA